MGDSSPTRSLDGLPSLTGLKRPSTATGLLPAFDPISSSPRSSFPPSKRVAREYSQTGKPLLPSFAEEYKPKAHYPSPATFPTSETNIPASSPPRDLTRRAPLARTLSTLSQREPLTDVPNVRLDASGDSMLFGRSAKSAHYQLPSVSKNISRVHLRAAYVPADPPSLARVEVRCLGWNGMKVHCEGKVWEMQKEDTFSSDSVDADIMVDVAGTRVVIQWPRIVRQADTPETSEDEGVGEESPSRRAARNLQNRSPFNGPAAQLQSPISPVQEPTPVSSDPPAIQIYEDSEDSSSGVATANQTQPKLAKKTNVADSFMTQDVSDDDGENEENDPIVHSFGPMGANLIPQMASFSATSPKSSRRARNTLKDKLASPRKRKREDDDDDDDEADLKPASPARVLFTSSDSIINHVVNQLAYSRLSQLPLSMVMKNLPTELKEKDGGKLDYDELRSLIGSATCIGEVRRVGKDAAGAPLESEYYYMPEKDLDEDRKEAVTGQLRKPGLRACRKQHKQYFWKKPK